jgi:hypothetical protein
MKCNKFSHGVSRIVLYIGWELSEILKSEISWFSITKGEVQSVSTIFLILAVGACMSHMTLYTISIFEILQAMHVRNS